MSHETPVVFVVDDDVSVRESLELLIRSAGWQPKTFESAQEFLSCPRALVPNCLILDVNLPDLSGLDLQRFVSVERTDMPIIFVTGYGDVPMTVKAMKAGAVEFLTKPFSDEVLLTAIEQALGAQQERACPELRDPCAAGSSRIPQPSGARGHGAGGHRSAEQAGRLRARYQRDHREGTPRPGDA